MLYKLAPFITPGDKSSKQ